MKVLAITQARYGSTRLPAKILKTVGDKTLLEIHLSRILQAKEISKLKIATTAEEGAKYIIEIADKLGVSYFQGSVDDVLSRFWGTAVPEKPDYVVRMTSDCPLIDPEVIDSVIRFATDGDYDYAATDFGSFPDGLDTEVFKFSALEKAYREADLTSEREHVTPYIWKNGSAKGGRIFKTGYLPCPEGDFSSYRITIDTAQDFDLLERVIEAKGTGCNWKEYIDFLNSRKDILSLNNMFGRNEGYEKSIRNDKKI